MEKIVTRLNLSFAETVETDEFVDAKQVLMAVCVRLIHHQFRAGSELLEMINEKTYISPDQAIFLEFIKAWLAVRNDGQRSDTIFTYNKILQEDRESLGVLWPIVASDLGYQYLCEGKLDAAGYYIELAIETFQDFKPEKHNYAALAIWASSSFYYLCTKKYDKAIYFAQLGIDHTQKKMIPGLVDVLYCNLAFALAGKEGQWTGESIKALYMAYTFAERTGNKKVYQKVVDALDEQGIVLLDRE